MIQYYRKVVEIMDFAKEMIAYRARHNLSQEKMAELMELSKGSIYKLEARKTEPRAVTVSKFEQLIEKE